MDAYPRMLVLSLVAVVLAAAGALADGSRLAVGDVIAVSVDGESEFTKTYQINKEGSITLPMVDPVKVTGLNTSDASAAIATALTKVLVNPQVTVAFVERAKMQVFVVGQVKTPGLVTVGVGDRVVQALAQAGYDDTADLSRVSVMRGSEIIKLDLTRYLKGEDLSVNVELESGDTVVVSQVDVIGAVLIVGPVETGGKMPLKRGMTFREALALAGGVTVEADTDNITIKREGVVEPLRVDYASAMDGDPAADIALQPGDTIYVKRLETAFFTVIGGVNKPGQYPLKGRLTLSEAIGLAGGAVTGVGDLRKVTITRGPESTTPGESITVNLRDVLAKAAEEPVIKRGDVISVKETKPKPNLFQVIQALVPLFWIWGR